MQLSLVLQNQKHGPWIHIKGCKRRLHMRPGFLSDGSTVVQPSLGVDLTSEQTKSGFERTLLIDFSTHCGEEAIHGRCAWNSRG